MSAKVTNLEKILNHPELKKIITKLSLGESPHNVSKYLKIKFGEKDEAHLRLTASALSDFKDEHLNQHRTLQQIVEDERKGKLDHRISESLLNTKAWRERIAKYTDGEIDFKQKILEVLSKLEIRAEQVFDKVQENPGNFKGDYVLLKYFEQIFMAIEKADKLINDKPDQLIQHNVTVQMVEDHSVAFQEAIRDLLKELDPDISSRFMELLSSKLNNLEAVDTVPIVHSAEERIAEVEKFLPIEDNNDYTG